MKRAPIIPLLDREQVLQAAKLSNPEARFLIADYYQAQEMRKRADMQRRHLGERVEERAILDYTGDSFAVLEDTVKRALHAYAKGKLVGRWCLAQTGVGPVISAGLLAHIDIEKAPTAGHIWRFAGQDPTCKWEEGQKRPYNQALKQICFHLGSCIMRTTWKESMYGDLYLEKKEELVKRNEFGAFAERAKTFFTKSADVKKTLSEGKLPPFNIDAQARRYVVKIFLSHLHGVMYWEHYKQPPPKPFAIQHLGHAHEIKIPDLDMFPGLEQAYYGRREAAE
jgi:hypothetical protein